MPLLLAVTLAAAIQPTCSWDNPGHNPYTGGVAAAVDRYTDIPEAVRSTLKRRMEEGQSDDQVSITRDNIAGKYQYNAAIRDMHFGKASVCATVTRDKWKENRNEPGAIYCVGDHCLLVPRICGNVSRVTRTAAAHIPPAATATQPTQQGRELEAPMEFADLGLADAPERTSPDEDEQDAENRATSKKLAMGALDAATPGMAGAPDAAVEILTEEELAEAADKARFGSFGRHGEFGESDEDFLRLNVSAVPEADSWAMLLAGLGLVGWQARRRARKAAK